MAHSELWQQLVELDRQETSRRAKCQYLADVDRYVITLLNRQYTVNLADREIFGVHSDSQQTPAEFLEQLCILSYLINSRDLPLADKLVKANSLRGGQFFFRGPHELPTERLEKTFGSNPTLIYEAITRLNAVQCTFGDASINLLVFPRIPLTFIIWGADEQFGARVSILFDQTAEMHMPLDALWAAVTLAVDSLVKPFCGGI
ncbi:MAG: DUF3786 domain-containing protein [Planctomycetota bacterium]